MNGLVDVGSRVALQICRRPSPLRNMERANGAKAFQFMLAAQDSWHRFEVDA
jgi:hypothetical protein